MKIHGMSNKFAHSAGSAWPARPQSKRPPKRKRKDPKESTGFFQDSADEPRIDTRSQVEMQDVEYLPQAGDRFGWNKVGFDPKLFGAKAELSGLLSIEMLSADDGDDFMRSLGHHQPSSGVGKKKQKTSTPPAPPTKKNEVGMASRRPKGSAEHSMGAPDAAGAAGPHGRDGKVKKAKSKSAQKSVDPGIDTDSAEHAASVEGGAEGGAEGERGVGQAGAAKSSKKAEKKAEKKRQLQLKRKAKRLARKHDAAGTVNKVPQAAAANQRPEEESFDDAWEYGEWGGVMLRKCLVRALEDLKFVEPTPIQAAVCGDPSHHP